MNEALLAIANQRGKNVTLLVLCGTLLAFFNPGAAASIFMVMGAAVSGPLIAEKWPGSTGSTQSTTGE